MQDVGALHELGAEGVAGLHWVARHGAGGKELREPAPVVPCSRPVAMQLLCCVHLPCDRTRSSLFRVFFQSFSFQNGHMVASRTCKRLQAGPKGAEAAYPAPCKLAAVHVHVHGPASRPVGGGGGCVVGDGGVQLGKGIQEGDVTQEQVAL